MLRFCRLARPASVVAARSPAPITRTALRTAAVRLMSTGSASEFAKQSGSGKLWGGRFSRDTDESIKSWTEAITIDSHLAVEDMWGSIAHNIMLGRQGIIPAGDAAKIIGVLETLQTAFMKGEWKIGSIQEDVHMDVEAHVIKALGLDVGGRMHTCRSRNDQVAVDSKMYCRRRLAELRGKTIDAAEAFVTVAQNYLNDVMPSYTHVQHAQPISVAFWLSHYAAVVLRDLIRLKSAYDGTDENPLGAGAIAGSSYPIDRSLTTRLLGFQKIQDHGLDGTSARDYFLESVSSAAILNTTWSRLAEEFILWSSYEFRTLTLDDGFAMGSSMMPQKKNPGALELMRGRAGRVNGLLVAAFTMMKGLPSGYNRDFHEDKEILVEALSLVIRATEVVPPLIKSTKINLARMAELPDYSFCTATELANFLVRKGVPFRKAHHIVGSCVGELSRKGQDFRNKEFVYEHLKSMGVEFQKKDVDAVLDPKTVMQAYNSLGGTGPKAVADMLAKYRAQIKQEREVLAADNKRIQSSFEACRAIAKEAPNANIKKPEDIQRLLDKYFPKK
jgi:argininosuccinate lyase